MTLFCIYYFYLFFFAWNSTKSELIVAKRVPVIASANDFSFFFCFSEFLYASELDNQAGMSMEFAGRQMRKPGFRFNDPSPSSFPCENCNSVFSRKHNLQYHLKFECGQSPRFNCPYCVYRTRHPSNVRAHVRRIHPGLLVHVIDVCNPDVL